MIAYPNSYVALSGDEIEYIEGGASTAGIAVSFAGCVLSIINAVSVVHIKQDLRKQEPDKDNVLLTLDAYNTYIQKPYGALMMVTGMALFVGGLIF